MMHPWSIDNVLRSVTQDPFFLLSVHRLFNAGPFDAPVGNDLYKIEKITIFKTARVTSDP
jgi:hypothetical protein